MRLCNAELHKRQPSGLSNCASVQRNFLDNTARLNRWKRWFVKSVSPDDHTPYTDLLEWRAIRHELEQLTRFLEAV